MSPSLFFIQLAILLLPGVLWARVDAVYGTKKGQSQFEFAVRAMLFGLTSYALTYLAFVMWGASFEVIDLARAAKDSILTRGIVIQVGVAMAVGFLASILWLYVVNYKLLTRLLQMIGATKTYGDEDVWDYTFNSNSAAVQFAHIRDFENKVVYSGWVNVFSETGKLRELVLYEVDVYDFEGNLLSSPPRLYIARKPEAMHIEFPIDANGQENVADVESSNLSLEERRKPWLRHSEGRL